MPRWQVETNPLVFSSIGIILEKSTKHPFGCPNQESGMENGSDICHSATFSHQLFADQVRKQYEHTLFGTAATLINSAILVLILRSHVAAATLAAWMACAVLVSACRLSLLWFYRRSGTQCSEPEKWNAWFIATLFLAGIFWGSAAVFLFPEDSIGHQVLIALVTGGMVAGAVSAFTAVITSFFLFSIPALLPICIRFYLAGSDIQMAMGAMAALYLLLISLTSARMHKDIVHLLALKYERSALIADLRQEVQRRKDAQEKLRNQKEQVEAIVDQRTAELRESEEKYRDLVENINDVIYAVNRDGEVTYVNPVVETVFGYSTGELIGKPFLNFIHHRDRQRAEEDFEQALKIASGPKVYRFLDKAGHERWCRASSRPALDGSDNSGIRGVLVDITQSKRLEAQLQRAQKMEALGALAGGVAHDLNNILSGIVSYPELLLMDLPEDSQLRKPLISIKDSGENAAAIVQDLLMLAGRGVPNQELLCLNQIVQRCLDAPEIRALSEHNPGIELAADLQPDLLRVHGSSIHIFKSLSNLIFNAAEAMPRGGRIEIATANRYADRVVSGFDTVGEGEYVVLSVTDSGIGIPESEQARIFEPFYSRKVLGGRGSGLGMAVVWAAVKDHNGYIDLQSQEGRGTRIELFFPATRDTMEEIQNPEDPEDYKGNGEFILVVDDVPLQREIATGILERLGYRAQAVSSGEEAVAFLRQRAADLVILDMILAPGMDGLETWRRLKRLCPRQKAVIASGYSETERVRQARDLGAARYIRKPYTLTTLARIVREVLQEP
jgi:two-component system, cell cycle sensor histidine kinase and response regulator CckA